MINFKFVKSQFKNIIIPMIVFFVLFFVLLIPSLFCSTFAPAKYIYHFEHGSGLRVLLSASQILPLTLYGIPAFILIFSFGIILIHILLVKEIDRGYMASWLTMPMSRNIILNSKLFVILSSILILNITILLLQLIFFAAIQQDFNKQVLGNVILTSFSFLFLSLLWTSINFVIMVYLNKSSVAITVAAGISTFFVICNILFNLSLVIEQLKFFKFIKYLTITSFFNVSFEFDVNNLTKEISNDTPDGYIYAKWKQINALKFAWQLPIMLIGASGLFALGNWIFIKKSLSL